MPTQLHSQARMMQYLAVVTSLVSFFRCLGGIFALTIMSSVVNNKVSSALSSFFPSGLSSSSLNSLSSIQSLPPSVLAIVQNAFSDAIQWAYIALLPFVGIAAISTFFLRDVKIERSANEEARRTAKGNEQDTELGQVGNTNVGVAGTQTHRPRHRIYGPLGLIIGSFQAIGDKTGRRK
jgi:hypothetical protein